MRELSLVEIESVCGGNAGAIALVLTIGAALAVTGYFSLQSKNCAEVEVPYNRSFPKYHPYTGVYIGDGVETLSRIEKVCS
ncbi:MAG: hypothetical protein ACHQJ6_02855 [Candidatus Berkiellales bacterium]